MGPLRSVRSLIAPTLAVLSDFGHHHIKAPLPCMVLDGPRGNSRKPPLIRTASRSAMNKVQLAAGCTAHILSALSGPPVLAQNCSRAIDLGNLGGTPTRAHAVTRDGTVVVGSSGFRAIRWDSVSGLLDIGGSTMDSQARGVSDDGTVIVGTARIGGDYRAFRWTSSAGLVDLGTLGGDESSAFDVSADGSVVVGRADDSGGLGTAYRWTAATGMVAIGGILSQADAVSVDGTVVVGTDFNLNRAFRWTAATGIVSLGSLGGNYSSAYDVSDDGNIVVGVVVGHTGLGPRGFRWEQATGMQLLPLLAGYSQATAFGISGDGLTIVGHGRNPLSFDRAFRWRATTGTHELRPIGEVKDTAWKASYDGEVVVGDLGNTAAFIWHGFGADEIGIPYCDSQSYPNSTLCSGRAYANGSTLFSANDITVGATALPLNAFGFFLTSRNQGSVFPVNNSQGRLCLGGFIGRYVGPGQIKNSGTTGAFSIMVNLTLMPQPFGGVSSQPGDSWHFQAWYRDANPQTISNFTDAVTVTLE
jgi:probable HAF family extracellular repeat protein